MCETAYNELSYRLDVEWGTCSTCTLQNIQISTLHKNIWIFTGCWCFSVATRRATARRMSTRSARRCWRTTAAAARRSWARPRWCSWATRSGWCRCGGRRRAGTRRSSSSGTTTSSSSTDPTTGETPCSVFTPDPHPSSPLILASPRTYQSTQHTCTSPYTCVPGNVGQSFSYFLLLRHFYVSLVLRSINFI